MVLPNYNIEKVPSGINGSSSGADVKDFRTANDDSLYVEKLFFDNEKDSKEFYEKLSLQELMDRFLRYVVHLSNLVLPVTYKLNGEREENLELKQLQEKLKKEVSEINDDYSKIDFLSDGRTKDQHDLMVVLNKVDEFIANLRVSQELSTERNYVLSIIKRLRGIIDNKIYTYNVNEDFNIDKRETEKLLEFFLKKYSKKYSISKEDVLAWFDLVEDFDTDSLMKDPILSVRIPEDSMRYLFIQDFLELKKQYNFIKN